MGNHKAQCIKPVFTVINKAISDHLFEYLEDSKQRSLSVERNPIVTKTTS